MKIYCNAGRSYVYVYPNGDIFRCETLKRFAFNECKELIVGNIIRNEWNPVKLKENLICNHYKKCFGCDSYLSKQIIEDNNNLKLVNRIHPYPNDEKYPNEFNDSYVVYSFILTFKCNYDCIYCNTNDFYHKDKETMNAKHVIDFFKKRKEQNSTGMVILSPMGEPTNFPDFDLIIDNLVDLDFDICITTNMSNYKIIEKITSRQQNQHKVKFQMSLHPFVKNFSFDRFLGTAAMIKRRNFQCHAMMVGNPLEMALYEKYKNELNKFGIEFIIQKDESEYGNREIDKISRTHGNDILEDNIKKFKSI